LASSSLVSLPSLLVSAAANRASSRASARCIASRASPALPAPRRLLDRHSPRLWKAKNLPWPKRCCPSPWRPCPCLAKR
jgi:hypothetical protein